MKFPGIRKKKHFFPVGQKGRVHIDNDFLTKGRSYVVGIDQLLVDIEVHVDDEFIHYQGLKKGESVVVDDLLAEQLYKWSKQQAKVKGEYAGGSIGNTIHNYSVLAEDRSVLLGSICKNILVGDYGFNYIATTNNNVDFSFLCPSSRPMGRALCFVTPDGERSFAISEGCMNELDSEFIPETVVANASALVLSAYLLRDPRSLIYQATMKASAIAKDKGVPIVLALGTSHIVEEKRVWLRDYIKQFVSVVAMNEFESAALTQISDPLLSCQAVLKMADMVLLTVGERGLYLGGHVDRSCARETSFELHSKSLLHYNQYEFSRAMRKADCDDPLEIYTHANPYMGGPPLLRNTNGAGDAALAAILHDFAANQYHREVVPNSNLHQRPFLSYLDLAQLAQYSSRASYEVLSSNSPRLCSSLPVTSDCLESIYWEK